MTALAHWFDPLVLGDLKAGAESIASIADKGELGVAIVLFAGIPGSQTQPHYTTSVEGLTINGEAYGSWSFHVDMTPPTKKPDPAQGWLLTRDGHEIRAVAMALDADLGADTAAAARRVAVGLMVQEAHEQGQASWAWVTPLGRKVVVRARRDA